MYIYNIIKPVLFKCINDPFLAAQIYGIVFMGTTEYVKKEIISQPYETMITSCSFLLVLGFSASIISSIGNLMLSTNCDYMVSCILIGESAYSLFKYFLSN